MEQEKQDKRMLIVDDEPNVAIALAENLEELGCRYSIEISNSAEEALSKINANDYAVVLTDYKLSGMTGLDLVREIQQSSPITQVVLMTAYGTPDLRETVKELEIGGYIDKPFTMSQIRDIVENVEDRDVIRESQTPDTTSKEIPVRRLLQNLISNTGAQCALLINSNGYPVDTAGVTVGMNVPAMSALVAANFAAQFKSSYHEGPDYNMYAYDVNGDLLLAVIFGQEIKPGAVWFYTKQTASLLAPLVLDQSAAVEISIDMTAALDAEIDRLLNPTDNLQELGIKDDDPVDNWQEQDGVDHEPDELNLLNLQDAIDAGLIPGQFPDFHQDED